MDFLPRIGVGGGLEVFAIGGEQRVEALLAENDAAWLALIKQFGLGEVLGEDFAAWAEDAVSRGLRRPRGRVTGGFEALPPGD